MTTPRSNKPPTQGLIDVLSMDTQQTLGISPSDVEYLPIRGMVRNKPPTQLVPGEGWTIKNLYWKDGTYRTRPGVSAVGPALDDPVCDVFLYTNAALGDYIFAAQDVGFSSFDGAAWNATTGTALTGNADSNFSFTQWGSSVIYSNGVDPIGAINVSGNSHAELSGSPPVVKTVMNFGRRIVGVGVAGNPERIQWCVSDNNGDWSGLSSGYEDLRAAPEGVVDSALIGIPITDESAIIVRRRSIWTMSRTNFYDIPFQFTRRYHTQGTESPHTFKLTPAGIIGLFLDDVYLFSDTQYPVPIGTAVRRDILNGGNLENARAVYDRYLREYRLFVPPNTRGGESIIWRYSLVDQRWTYDEVPFDISGIASAYYTIDPTIDSIEDVVDTVETVIDDMDGIASTTGLIVSQYGETGQVVGQFLDGNPLDIGQGSIVDDQPIEIIAELGELTPGTSLRRVNLIESQIEYETSSQIDVAMETSEDRGAVWNLYDMWTLSIVGVPSIVRFTKYLESKRLTLRITSPNSMGFSLISWILRTNVGSKDAH